MARSNRSDPDAAPSPKRRAPARRFLGGVLLAIVSALTVQPARADCCTAYATVLAWGSSEPVSIDEYAGDWHGHLDRKGADASAFLWMETGMRWRQWSFSVLTEQFALFDATRQTAALYHRVKNHLPFETGESFRIDLDAMFVQMQGFRLGRTFQPLPGWTAQAGLSLFDGFSLDDGRLHGHATAVGPKDYTYQADVHYFYDEDILFGRRVPPPKSFGAALDVGLSGHVQPWLSLDLRVFNALGRLWWKDAPFSSGHADSATRHYGDDGYARFDPVLRGREGNENFHELLPAFGIGELTWDRRHAVSPGMRVRADRLKVLASVFAALPTPAGRFELEVLPRPLGLGVAWSGRYGELRLLSDRWNPADAHTLASTVSIRIDL